MNNVVLCGRLTKTPELRTTKNEKPVCEFNIAVNRIGQDEADFITCVVYGNQATNLCKYQGKGSQIALAGSLRVDNWDDEKGQRRYKTYVLANNIEYLGTRKEENTNADIVQNEPTVNEEDPFKTFSEQVQITDDDLPF